MHISSAHKERLANVARFATAGAMVVSSLAVAVASPVNAGSTTTNKTTVSDSRPGQSGSTYTIKFTPNTSSTTEIAKVGVRFCNSSAGWTSCSTGPTGLDVPSNISAASASGFTGTSPVFNQINSHEFEVAFTSASASEAIAEKTITLTGLMTNPTSQGTYYTIVRTYNASDVQIDQGVSAFAIVDRVIVSGRVAESMAFTVAGVTQGAACGGSENASVTSTPTAISFGNFVAGTPSVACQTVAVATNAVGGYAVTVKPTLGGASPLGGMCRQTATGCSADGVDNGGTIGANYIADAGLTATPATWDLGTTKGVGLNANGGQVSGFGSASLFRTMFGTDPIEVAKTTAPTAATPTTVKLKVDVPATQTAGVYQNSLQYVATPIF